MIKELIVVINLLTDYGTFKPAPELEGELLVSKTEVTQHGEIFKSTIRVPMDSEDKNIVNDYADRYSDAISLRDTGISFSKITKEDGYLITEISINQNLIAGED